ncbi:hypothetical protein GOODEAATRI_021306 [Goodea atripinnis]|uniref:PH domain-containing protein n=1 Tax=Goodea atripinnis TaxID=208336 RepID=A0ABV0Q0I5_9TELE
MKQPEKIGHAHGLQISYLEDEHTRNLFVYHENGQDHGYTVSESSGRCTRSGRWHCGITLETPSRQFVFMCEQEQERREWLEAFGKVISQPMTPEDYASTMMLFQKKQCRPSQIKEAFSQPTLSLFSYR